MLSIKNAVFRKTNHTTNIIIFIAWFFPIFFAVQSKGFGYYGFNLVIAKAFYVIPALLGLAFFAAMFLLRKNISVNKYAFLLLIFLYGSALLSDVGEYVQVFYFVLYGLVVSLIGYNYPKIIFRQYIIVCWVIVALAVVDYFKYYVTGSTIFHWHALGIIPPGILRSHTFFNEPAHQAGFLMPALLYFLFSEHKRSNVKIPLLLFAYFSTFSVGAIVVLIVPIIYYLYKKKISFLNVFVLFVVISGLVLLSGDFIMSKLESAVYTERYYSSTNISSGANYIAIRDIAQNTRLADLVFGVGYYNVGTLFADYLKSAELGLYYFSQRFYDGDYTSTTIIRLIYSFGILGGVIIVGLVKLFFRSTRDPLLSTITVVSLILLSIKNTHALDDLVLIFFLFGLFWGDGEERILKRDMNQLHSGGGR